jgi:hypothetical protein
MRSRAGNRCALTISKFAPRPNRDLALILKKLEIHLIIMHWALAAIVGFGMSIFAGWRVAEALLPQNTTSPKNQTHIS